MFSTLMTLLCGIFYVHDELATGQRTQEWKYKAEKSGSPVYMDGRGKFRSIETNEIVFARYVGKTFPGVIYEGVKSGRIYANTVYDKVNEENKKLAERGKKFRYQVFPQWRYEALPVDMENGLPYKIDVVLPGLYYEGRITLRYITDFNCSFPDTDIKMPAKILKYNEGKCYYRFGN